MAHFSSVLVLLDPEQDDTSWLQEQAFAFAAHHRCRLTFALAIPEDGIQQIERYNLLGAKTNLQDLIDNLRHELKESIKPPNDTVTQVEYDILVGDGPVEIVRAVLRRGHDLVVKQRSPGTKIDHLAQKLFRKCPCPVYLLKQTDNAMAPILVALDLDTGSDEGKMLNRLLVNIATTIGDPTGAPVHFLNTWNLQLELLLHGPRFNVTIKDIDTVKGRIREERQTLANHLFDECGIRVDSSSCHIIEGQLEEVMTSTVEQLNIGTLIMGSVGRSGASGVLIGNSAERILAHTECSILAAKPHGFISPISL